MEPLVWVTKTITNPIFLRQKRAMRIINRADDHGHTNVLYTNSQFLRSTDQVDFKTAQITYKVNNNTPANTTQACRFREVGWECVWGGPPPVPVYPVVPPPPAGWLGSAAWVVRLLILGCRWWRVAAAPRPGGGVVWVGLGVPGVWRARCRGLRQFIALEWCQGLAMLCPYLVGLGTTMATSWSARLPGLGGSLHGPPH